MIKIISDYVKERKELWLEPRLKKAESEEEIATLKKEAEERFSLTQWLQDAARRAGQLNMTSHPSKFSHPSAKSSSIIANNIQDQDGYLRSGNVDVPLDVFGNAAAMDVYRLLALPLKEGSKEIVLNIFENNHEQLKAQIENLGLSFKELRNNFLQIKKDEEKPRTDSLLKQVYFPINSKAHQYHLLSLLTPSGTISLLKERIDKIRFSEETKIAREARRAETHHDSGYKDLLNLTVVGFGGTKPQNISVLNNQNYGKAYLLSSTPPSFTKRNIRMPTRDFFTQTLYLHGEKDRFETLHRWVMQERNNIEVRRVITNIIAGIIDSILYRAYQLRESNEPGWTLNEYYQNLPKNQRIWLDNHYRKVRQDDQGWRGEIARGMSNSIVLAYDKINSMRLLGDPEQHYIRTLIAESIDQDKEFF